MKGHFGPINALAFNPDGKRYEANKFSLLIYYLLMKPDVVVCCVSNGSMYKNPFYGKLKFVVPIVLYEMIY